VKTIIVGGSLLKIEIEIQKRSKTTFTQKFSKFRFQFNNSVKKFSLIISGRVHELLKIINIRLSMHFPKNGRNTRFPDLINDSRSQLNFNRN